MEPGPDEAMSERQGLLAQKGQGTSPPHAFSRRSLVGAGLFLFAVPGLASKIRLTVDSREDPYPDLILPPPESSQRGLWRDALKSWRSKFLQGFPDAIYRDPKTKWAQTCYCCHKIMVWDESFLDAKSGKYKVEEYLEAGRKIFGGFDAVVLWQAYPRIGFDDRNQFDYYRELPGGLPGLADVVRRFHLQGVRVFEDFNPWDTGTRREATSDEVAIADLVRAIDADGVFLDTMTKANSSMRTALDDKKAGVVFETELPLPVEGLESNQLSWAQWLQKTEVPGVLRDHWIERRHMMHAIRRWDTDHKNEIHMAWMNGAGILVWENIFGSWNPWSDENCRVLRKVLAVQRHFSPFFLEGDWEPLVDTNSSQVWASSWTKKGSILWTAVNPGEKQALPGWLKINLENGNRLFDLMQGLEISSSPAIGPGNVAGLLSIPGHLVDESFTNFLRRQREESENRLVVDRSRLIVPVPSERGPEHTLIPPGMRSVPGGKFTLTSHFRTRECGERGNADYKNQIYPELHLRMDETHVQRFTAFAITEQDVSNHEFFEFLKETGYRPPIADSFLKHWSDPAKKDNDEPVVFVSVEDAQAYAKWKGGRLPTDLEWQFVMELLRLERGERAVWNWTSSLYTDRQTRFVLIKGGADFEAKGSVWYADGGRKDPGFIAKFIQIWPGLDRCATIGFRYVVDLH